MVTNPKPLTLSDIKTAGKFGLVCFTIGVLAGRTKKPKVVNNYISVLNPNTI